MTDILTPQQADRKAAATFFHYATWQDSQENGGTHGPIVTARLAELLAHHAQQARLEERERCAGIIETAHEAVAGLPEAHWARSPVRSIVTAIRKGEAV